MKFKIIRSLVLAAVMLTGSAARVSAAEPTKENAALSAKLITALEKSDYETFIADWGAMAKKSLKREWFVSTCTLFAARFHAGYEISYLGDLRQNGSELSLWKISFKNHGDDALVTLVMKEGKIAGFWIK